MKYARWRIKFLPFKILLSAFPSLRTNGRKTFVARVAPRNSRNQRRRYAVPISGGHRKPLCMTLKETKRSPRGASFDAQKKRRDKGESLSRKSVARAVCACARVCQVSVSPPFFSIRKLVVRFRHLFSPRFDLSSVKI